MQSHQTNIQDLLFSAGGQRFYVPPYQREYVWETKGENEQAAEFWNDVYARCFEERKHHFLGVLVFQQRVLSTFNVAWDIVDGQQRMTSASLLLIAIRDTLNEAQEALGPMLELLSTEHQSLTLANGPNRDGTVFSSLADGMANQLPAHLKEQSRILKAYRYFRTTLTRHFGEDWALMKEFAKTVTALPTTLCVFLEVQDPADVIFETLNGRGKAVDPIDLVKNLILGIGEGDQMLRQDARNLWEYLISEFDEQDLGECLRALGERDGVRTVRRSAYSEIKADITEAEKKNQLGVWLANASKAVKIYADILSPQASQRQLLRLERLGFNRALDSVILRIVELDGPNSPLLKALESLCVRIFMSYPKPTCKFRRLVDNTCDFFGNVFYQPKAWRQNLLGCWKSNWPDDDQFAQAILTKRVYGSGVQRRRLLYLLERIEASLASKLPVSLQFDANACSIEHVMPQKLSAEWKCTLGGQGNLMEIHSQLLHTLGNLTVLLIPDNSRLQNGPFKKKKQFYVNPDSYSKEERKRLKIEPLEGPINNCLLNSSFQKVDTWTFDSVKTRGQHLAKISQNIWKDYDYFAKTISD